MINKSQLFEQLAGKTSTIKLGQLELVIRSLSFADVQQIQSLELDGFETSLHFIIAGLVEPKLSEDDLDTLKQSNPKALFEIAKHIQELSGLESEEAFLADGG